MFQVFSSDENPNRQKVAKSILGYFSGFEAFSLPPPTADKELLKNIKDNKSQMIPFFQELHKFEGLLKSILTPKRSFNEGELVTGEGTNIFVILGEYKTPVSFTIAMTCMICKFLVDISFFQSHIGKESS